MASDEILARLLAGRDAPSVLEKEADFEAIYARVDTTRARRGRRWAWFGGIAAAAALALVALPWTTRPDDGFQARGSGAGERFAVTCVGATEAKGACHPGDRLVLELEPSPERHFFALFLQRPDGALVWYFPSANGTMPDVSQQHLGAPWQETALLPTEGPVGTQVLFGIFAPEPLDRAALKQVLGDALEGDADVRVVRLPLVLEQSP